MAFEWKLTDTETGNEIYFPRGSRRFVKVDVEPIDDGPIERDIYGNAVYMGDPSFWRHRISMSCSDVTNAPISNIFRNKKLTLQSPKEESVPGPVATLNTAAVGGSCYGVDANDNVVGHAEPVDNVVTIPGAVSIRYRPIFECVVINRSGGETSGKANASWSIEMEELYGNEVSLTPSVQYLTVTNSVLSFVNSVGESFSEDISGNIEENVSVSFGVSNGNLPDGITFSNGVFSGDFTSSGSFIVAVEAVADGYEPTVMNVVFFVEEEVLPELTLSQNTILIEDFLQEQIILPISNYINENETITYTIADGALPGGISLASDGTVNGIYNEEGSFVTVIQASASGYDPVEISLVFIIESESDIKMYKGITKRLTTTQAFSAGQAIDVNTSSVTKSSAEFASVQQSDNFARIPANITKVRVYIGLRPNVAQDFTAWAEHFDSSDNLKEQFIAITNPSNARITKSSSSIIDVEEGDYFKLVFISTSNSSLIALPNHDDGSYLEIEAVAGYSQEAKAGLIGFAEIQRNSSTYFAQNDYRSYFRDCSFENIIGDVGSLDSSNGRITVPEGAEYVVLNYGARVSGFSSSNFIAIRYLSEIQTVNGGDSAGDYLVTYTGSSPVGVYKRKVTPGDKISISAYFQNQNVTLPVDSISNQVGSVEFFRGI